MPQVRNIHATVVHGRDQRAHVASRRPPIRAEIANANATENPTYPMYSIGGCATIAGSCSRGFKSLPSGGTGNRRANGLEVNSMNSRKPVLTIAITDNTRATISSGRWLLNKVTATIQTVSMKVQSSS